MKTFSQNCSSSALFFLHFPGFVEFVTLTSCQFPVLFLLRREKKCNDLLLFLYTTVYIFFPLIPSLAREPRTIFLIHSNMHFVLWKML